MQPHTIIRKTIIKRPLEEVFQFFSKAENLNLLTPPELSFKILTPLPIKMQAFPDVFPLHFVDDAASIG